MIKPLNQMCSLLLEESFKDPLNSQEREIV